MAASRKPATPTAWFAFARGLDEAIGLLRQCAGGQRAGQALCQRLLRGEAAEYVEYARVISPWERRYLLLRCKQQGLNWLRRRKGDRTRIASAAQCAKP